MLTEKEIHKLRKISKFISLVLRHEPEKIGITLDEQGWVEVDEFLSKCNKYISIDFETLIKVIENNDKNRFSLSSDNKYIRANHGHSVQVDLNYKPEIPPEFLYHGTAIANLDAIKQTGILKQNRIHVHLSPDKETAFLVGSRHGKAVVLKIKAREMFDAGINFYLSPSKIWLVENISPEFIIFEE